MSVLTQTKRYTPDEYSALEEEAEYKSEYENGEIIAMAGGTLNHLQITANAARFIGNKVSENCRSLPSEMKV